MVKEMPGQLVSIQTTQSESGWETLTELVLQIFPVLKLLFHFCSICSMQSIITPMLKWFEAPEELITREVCSESGLIPTQLLHKCNS